MEREEKKEGQEREREGGREEGMKEGRKKGVDMCMHVYVCVCVGEKIPYKDRTLDKTRKYPDNLILISALQIEYYKVCKHMTCTAFWR